MMSTCWSKNWRKEGGTSGISWKHNFVKINNICKTNKKCMPKIITTKNIMKLKL